MKQSNPELNQFSAQAIKWACRLIFLFIASLMSYVVSRPAYNFAHWVPHQSLKQLGVPYQTVLWAEQNAGYLLHFAGGLALTVLLYGANFFALNSRPLAIFCFVSSLCLGAEILQFYLGRGFESGDLLLGILGSFMAYLAFNQKN